MKLTLCLVLAGVAVSGCVSVHRVAIQDAPRKTVRFESGESQRALYDAILARHFSTTGKPSRVRVGATIFTKETRASANVVFNEAVIAADTNGDGAISDHEAARFYQASGERGH